MAFDVFFSNAIKFLIFYGVLAAFCVKRVYLYQRSLISLCFRIFACASISTYTQPFLNIWNPVQAMGKIGEWDEIKEGFFISTNRQLLDIDFIHGFLSKEAYWSIGMPKDVVQRAIDNSLCFGVFHGQKQVGFARCITDRATFAYLGDVFIASDYRKQELGKLLIDYIMKFPDLLGLRRMLLFTRDAHKLYEKFGWRPVKTPERIMEVHNPDVYKSAKS